MPSPVRFIRFGLFEADLQSGELRKDGLKIKLQEQPFRVLTLLLERAGEVVTREELRQKLWSTDTFVDFEHGLNTSVKKLRQALGDSADNPRFVETLARRGYRFITPVEPVGERLSNSNVAVDEGAASSLPLVVPSGPQEVKKGSSGQRVRWGKVGTWAAVVTGLIVAGAGWLYVHRSPALPLMKVVRFTSYPGTEKDPAISPDGKRLAFVWDSEGADNFDVYVRSIGPAGDLPITVEKPLRITTDPAPDLSPTWSPDGRYLAFARVSEGNSAVYVVPSMGGQERRLTELHFGPVTDAKLLDWSPDGKSLAVAAMSSPEDRRGIYSISLDKGDRQKLTFPPPGFGGDKSPVFSPDGQTLAFTRVSGYTDLYLLSLNHGEPKRLSANARWSFNSAWTADSQEIVFGSWAGGSRQLWRVGVSGAKPEPLAIGANGEDPTISRHANRLAYVERIYNTDIWRIETPTSQKQGVPPTTLGLNSSQEDSNPQYSPDGRSIVFVSRRSGSYEIWVCDSEGRNSRPLTSFPEASVTASPRWSQDSRQIAFDSWEKGRSKIFVVSREGGSPRCLTERTPDAFLASWSRDGRWIYYCSGRSGDDQIWRMPAEGGEAVRVTKNGGFESFAAPDGKTLFYTKLDQVGSAHIWKIPVEGGEETLVFDIGIYRRFWSLTDEGIYFVPSDWSPRPTIEFFSFATGKITHVAALEKPPARYFHPGLSISPDGRQILCALVQQDTSDIMLVENFR